MLIQANWLLASAKFWAFYGCINPLIELSAKKEIIAILQISDFVLMTYFFLF